MGNTVAHSSRPSRAPWPAVKSVGKPMRESRVRFRRTLPRSLDMSGIRKRAVASLNANRALPRLYWIGIRSCVRSVSRVSLVEEGSTRIEFDGPVAASGFAVMRTGAS